jgi:peptidyl-prolyl cis-trans isomerase C
LNHSDTAALTKFAQQKSYRRMSCAALVIALVAGLSGCGKKEQKSGQALVSVNGEEITALQLNEELQRSNVPVAQQEQASKQLLEQLIDRQLLENEAARDKTDRDPKVVQAIERAKALIIAQAYMQKRIGSMARPTKAEIEDYFQKHPEFFTHRKQFDMRELVVATSDINDALKAELDSTKSLDDVATWLDGHQIKFARNQVSRTTADLPPELGTKLQTMPKGQIFIIREGERSMLISIADIKEAPVDLDTASPQIEQYLINTRNKEAAAAEIARLRASAKIEYLNKAAGASAPTAATAKPAQAEGDATARGVAGLK